jgi:hypothetical protein
MVWGRGAPVLLETRGLGYDKHFDANLDTKQYFRGAVRLIRQARRQEQVAHGIPIRWHVAEPRMVAILKKLFDANHIKGIDVVSAGAPPRPMRFWPREGHARPWPG